VGHAWARSSRLQPPHAEPHDAVSAAETLSGRGWGSLGSGLPGGCSWAVAGPPGKSRVHIADGVTAGADGSAHRSLSRMPECRARAGTIVCTREVLLRCTLGLCRVDDGDQAGSRGPLLPRIS